MSFKIQNDSEKNKKQGDMARENMKNIKIKIKNRSSGTHQTLFFIYTRYNYKNLNRIILTIP